MFSSPVGRFRAVALAEGVSALLLFFVAMPIKYVPALGSDPTPVKYVGWAHGVLCIAFGVAGLQARGARGWPWSSAVWGALAALVPFGTFVYDARFLKPEHARESAERGAARASQNPT